ncbi:MAG: hypothetical protein FWD39_06325 [Clostridiales bacterium]|nr:hypothetical protein [Clostridiales bacterium]
MKRAIKEVAVESGDPASAEQAETTAPTFSVSALSFLAEERLFSVFLSGGVL